MLRRRVTIDSRTSGWSSTTIAENARALDPFAWVGMLSSAFSRPVLTVSSTCLG
jgi:hypothetical protein